MYMGFLNNNKIFDIDILNLETDCSNSYLPDWRANFTSQLW